MHNCHMHAILAICIMMRARYMVVMSVALGNELVFVMVFLVCKTLYTILYDYMIIIYV